MMPLVSDPPKDKQRRGATTAARGVSWMSLVAATTLSLGQVDQLSARVRAVDLAEDARTYRLIVQAYSRASLAGLVPTPYARPSASTQRAVTPEELANGIDVKLVQLDELTTQEDAVVIAWIEQGEPDLEYDARRARPQKDAYYGVASDHEGQIVLRRHDA